MKKLQDMTFPSSNDSVSSYLNLYKQIDSEIKKGAVQAKNSIKIALLTSFNSRSLKEILFVKCASIGILADIYVSEYNQYKQDIIDPASKLYQFAPDLLILFVDIHTVLGELFFFPYHLSAAERRDWVINQFMEFINLIDLFKARSSAMVLLHNFEVPTYSPLGIQENKQAYGYIESIEDLNKTLRDGSKETSLFDIFNYDAFCSKVGKNKLVDPKMYYLGDIKLDLQKFPALCDEYLAYLKPLMNLSKKCLVLDLDQTLWGGIIGEDGYEGIHLGPTPEGRPYWEFQKHLLALFDRGVILAVNSKNNLEEALKVIREHPYMVLREEHFAAMRINWQDKAANLKSIAEELNIGLYSLVFIDNDPLNRELIQQTLPEVSVPDFPNDASQYANTLMQLSDFNTLQLTDEDLKRGKYYAARRQISAETKNASNITEYLKSLETEVTIKKATSFSIPRIAQLTQKTNQFNMTTRRYTQEEITQLSNNNSYLVFSVSVKDKFGDHGIVGVLIINQQKELWRIDTFLLSCRVIGRKVEDAVLGFIIEQARVAKMPLLKGEVIPTSKNTPALDFYKNQQFTSLSSEGDSQLWAYKTDQKFNSPEYIKIIVEEN